MRTETVTATKLGFLARLETGGPSADALTLTLGQAK